MAKKALLVGINDYPGTQNDLFGCVNDITNVYDVLVKYFGFAPSDMTLLSDARARKAAILEALENLLGGAQAGDTIVFHYSGHGSQVRDTEGDELDDGKDEVICPVDFNWTDGFIKDDDLAALIGGMKKGVRLEVHPGFLPLRHRHARDHPGPAFTRRGIRARRLPFRRR